MPPLATETEPKITFTPEDASDDTRVELWVDGGAVCRLWVVPFTIRIGRATVRMDGIGGVGTTEEHRNKGYARRMLDAAVDWMAGRDAALTMLYGISDFYPKFGYATAGPDHLLYLSPPMPGAPPPEGWQIRPFQEEDLPAVQRLYDLNTSNAVGAAARAPESGSWSRLRKAAGPDATDECRVAVSPSGEVAAYAWRGSHFWYIKDKLGPHHPDALILAEVMADGPGAADAILAGCRAWAAEEAERDGNKGRRILTVLPPEGPVADAARHLNASLTQYQSLSGDSMARVLNVERLLKALEPELAARWEATGSDWTGALHFQTDIGDAVLSLAPNGFTAGSSDSPPVGAIPVRLPQPTLARLALGAFPPHDLLARLETPVGERAAEMLQTLFPFRRPHMSIPDRF